MINPKQFWAMSEMKKKKKTYNPFYAAVVVVGTAFVISACAYGVVAVKQIDSARAFEARPQDETFVEFVDQRGPAILLIELALLGVTSIAAMATDDFWTRRGQRPVSQKQTH